MPEERHQQLFHSNVQFFFPIVSLGSFFIFFPSSAGWAMACSYETSVQLHNGPDFSLFEGQEGHAK